MIVVHRTKDLYRVVMVDQSKINIYVTTTPKIIMVIWLFEFSY